MDLLGEAFRIIYGDEYELFNVNFSYKARQLKPSIHNQKIFNSTPVYDLLILKSLYNCEIARQVMVKLTAKERLGVNFLSKSDSRLTMEFNDSFWVKAV